MKLNEDVYFTAEIIRNAKTYDRYNKVVYAVRRTHKVSRTQHTSRKKENLQNMYIIFNMIFEIPEINTRILDFLASPYAYALGMAAGALENSKTTNDKNEIYSNLKQFEKYAFTMKHSGRRYIKGIYLIYQLFGQNITIELLKLYLKLRKHHKLSIRREN